MTILTTFITLIIFPEVAMNLPRKTMFGLRMLQLLIISFDFLMIIEMPELQFGDWEAKIHAFGLFMPEI